MHLVFENAKILHKSARTTPKIRKEIQESKLSIKALASLYNINKTTVLKWKKRNFTLDMKMGPTPKSTVLSEEEEKICVIFREKTLLPLDACLFELRKTIPKLTRSSLHRLFVRNKINVIPKITEEKVKTKFEKAEVGFIHIDITHLRSEESKIYLYVAIDRVTKFSFAKIYNAETVENSISFLSSIIKTYEHDIHTVFTDNGMQFTNRPNQKKSKFDQFCSNYNIKHKLTKPYHPWTNGQVEHMNQTIKSETIKKYYYKNNLELEKHLNSFLNLYNYAKPLRALNGLTPYESVLKHKKNIEKNCEKIYSNIEEKSTDLILGPNT
jgi:transposase-like protein